MVTTNETRRDVHGPFGLAEESSLLLDVYRVSTRFPSHELYGLTAQLRRSAVSVPANIAEGFRKRGKGDKLRYFNIAQGSLEEAPLLSDSCPRLGIFGYQRKCGRAGSESVGPKLLCQSKTI